MYRSNFFFYIWCFGFSILILMRFSSFFFLSLSLLPVEYPSTVGNGSCCRWSQKSPGSFSLRLKSQCEIRQSLPIFQPSRAKRETNNTSHSHRHTTTQIRTWIIISNRRTEPEPAEQIWWQWKLCDLAFCVEGKSCSLSVHPSILIPTFFFLSFLDQTTQKTNHTT